MTLLLALAIAAADPAGAVVAAKPKVLVLDFRDDGVGANAVRIIHDTLVAHLSKDTRVEVASSEDLRRIVDVDAQKRAIGCSDESCMAEIAEALGAQLTIYGTAGKLGDLVVVNVNLFDARAARSMDRETVEVGSLDALPGPLRRAGDKLIAKLGLVVPPTVLGPIFWTGAVVGGVGALTGVVGGVVALMSDSQIAKETTFEKKTSAAAGRDMFTGIAVGGAVGAVVGVGVLATGLLVE